MNIHILCVGKIKEEYYRGAVKEYLKRLSSYAKVEVTEVEDERTKEEASEKEINAVLDKEGERLLSKIPDQAYVIATAIKGETFDSEGLSKKLENYGLTGKSDLYILIGGSLGLSEKVYARVNERWSFSRLTFPHQLMRVILLEQIYRGFRILRHEPYHK